MVDIRRITDHTYVAHFGQEGENVSITRTEGGFNIFLDGWAVPRAKITYAEREIYYGAIGRIADTLQLELLFTRLPFEEFPEEWRPQLEHIRQRIDELYNAE